MRTPAEERPTLHHAMEGLRFIRSRPVLLGAIALDMFAVLFGGAVALLPAIAEDRLDVGSVGYGWLRAAPGVGAVIVTAVLAIRPVRRHVGRTLFVAVAVFGVATIVLGITGNFAVAFVALLVLAGADAVSVFIRATIVPLATPDRMRGRVMAVENVFIGASNELGAFESGVAGAVLGVGPAVWVGGVLTLGVVGVWSRRVPGAARHRPLRGRRRRRRGRRPDPGAAVWLTLHVRRRARRATWSADPRRNSEEVPGRVQGLHQQGRRRHRRRRLGDGPVLQGDRGRRARRA